MSGTSIGDNFEPLEDDRKPSTVGDNGGVVNSSLIEVLASGGSVWIDT